MQGYHFVLFYLPVFVNPVGLVELEGCCGEGGKRKPKQPAGQRTALSDEQVASTPLAFIQQTVRASPGPLERVLNCRHETFLLKVVLSVSSSQPNVMKTDIMEHIHLCLRGTIANTQPSVQSEGYPTARSDLERDVDPKVVSTSPP